MPVYNPSAELSFKRVLGATTITSAGTTYSATVTPVNPVAGGVGIVSVGNMAADATDTMTITLQGAHGETVTNYNNTQDTSLELLEGATTNVKLAAKLVVGGTAIEGIPRIGLWLKRVGSVSGNISVKIEPDSSGDPSGTAITNGTSANVDASALSTSFAWVEFSFAIEPTLSASTTYWIVLQGTYSASGSVNVEWGIDTVASGGLVSKFDNTSWTAVTTQTPNMYYVTRDYSDIGSFSAMLGDGTNENTVVELEIPEAYNFIRAKMVGASGNSLSAPIESIVIGYPKKGV